VSALPAPQPRPPTVPSPAALPHPVIKRSRWRTWLVWIVPLLALIGAGLYLRDFLAHRGRTIHVRFADGDGLRAEETHVQYKGVIIGEVMAVAVSSDHRWVDTTIRLDHGQDDFAKKGADYWIVRPEVSVSGLTGLGTVLSGPYIEAIPGDGARIRELTGLSRAPLPYSPGHRFYVRADRLEHLSPGAPVLYRGVQVGAVRDIRLSRDASQVEAQINVWRRYLPLVRAGSRFWILSGLDVRGGLLSGVRLDFESMRTLLSGGIAFATPEGGEMGAPAAEGSVFEAAQHAEDDWLKWRAKIPIR
jgi:paraquat-inducible protein B